MDIIIIGCGKVGTTLAEQLVREDHNVVMIDTSAERMQRVSDDIDAIKLVGNGASISMQIEAGVQTADMLMMEHGRGGLRRFLSGIPVGPERPVGSIVCHANPFTLGHRHLLAYAAARCAQVLVFVLSDTDSLFPPELRLRLVREGTADLPNVRAYPGGDYLISPATFPAYFLKDQARAPEAKCDLDLTLFGSAIAPALHITERFVGQEPTCAVTAQYNRRMQAILPAYGIHVTEIPRLSAISATTVRARLQEGDVAAVRALVPETTYEACRSLFGAGAPCP